METRLVYRATHPSAVIMRMHVDAYRSLCSVFEAALSPGVQQLGRSLGLVRRVGM